MVAAAQVFSTIVNVVTSLYLLFLMLIIGYGLDTYNSFSIGRIDAAQGRELLNGMVLDRADNNDGGDNDNDVTKRLVMAVLINFRINICAWYAIWFTTLYGLCLPLEQRGTIHLLGFLANLHTLLLHLWHRSGGDEPLVPHDDPYHNIPIPFDASVAVLNLVAFVVVAVSTRKEKGRHNKAD